MNIDLFDNKNRRESQKPILTSIVTSVNGKTGNVELSNIDVNAIAPADVAQLIDARLITTGDGTHYLSDNGEYKGIDVSPETVAEAVEDYFENHPVLDDTNTSDTTTYSSEKIEQTFAKETDIPTNVSELNNDSDYQTSSDIASILSVYAKKSELPNVPTKTSELINDSGYLTEHQSLNNYYTKSETDTEITNKGFITDADAESKYAQLVNIPTKTSELVNDSGFLTSHQSLTGYATENYVQSGFVAKENGKGLSTNDYTTADKTKVANSITQIKTINGEALVGIGNIEIDGGAVDSVNNKTGNVILYADDIDDANGLSIQDDIDSIQSSLTELSTDKQEKSTLETDVANKGFTKNIGTVTDIKVGATTYSPSSGLVTLPEYPTVPTKVSDIVNDSGFITSSALSDYATENYVQNGFVAKEAGKGLSTNDLTNAKNEKLLSMAKDFVAINSENGTLSLELNNGKMYYVNVYNTDESIGLSSLTLTLNTNIDATLDADFSCIFSTSSNGCTISLPQACKWDGGTVPTIKSNTIYEININIISVVYISKGVSISA